MSEPSSVSRAPAAKPPAPPPLAGGAAGDAKPVTPKAPPAPVARSGWVEREITFLSGGENVSATLLHPDVEAVQNRGATPQQRKGGVRSWAILVHGLLSDRRELGGLPKALAEAGIGVVALDWRGHGRSGGPRGLISPARAQEDLAAAQAWIRAYEWADAERFAFIGHSLGAAMVLSYGAHVWPHDVIVAASCPDTIRGEMNPLARLGYAFLYAMKGRNGGGASVSYRVNYRHLFADADAAERARSIGFLQDRVPLASYPGLMEVDAASWASVCRAPALYLVSRRDRVVSPRASRRVAAAHSGPKTVEVLDDVGHSMFLDRRGPEVVAGVVAYVTKRLAAYPEIRG